jgi:hypothetical protein
MKLFLLIVFLFCLTTAYCQPTTLPTWCTEAFQHKGLHKKYTIASYLKPSYLQADFNGDATQDIAVLIIEKATKKKGVLLMHGKTKVHFVFGAGIKLDSDDGDFIWVDKWQLYTKKTAFETQFDKESGDIIGGKEIKLARPGILIEDYEDGSPLAGVIIYWNGKKYIPIHQGE